MVNRRISNDLKECALRLWENGWEEHDICAALCVSRASLYRWQSIFDEFGAVRRPPSPLLGRTRIITRAVFSSLHLLLKDNPDTYLDELSYWLAVYHDIKISSSALHHTLQTAGLTRKLLHKIARERDEELRTEWRDMIRDNFGGQGYEFIFVDETSKDDRTTARRYGYAMSGQTAELHHVFKRGTRYSVVAALSKEGYIASRVVEGSLDSFEFFDFIAEEVVSLTQFLLTIY